MTFSLRRLSEVFFSGLRMCLCASKALYMSCCSLIIWPEPLSHWILGGKKPDSLVYHPITSIHQSSHSAGTECMNGLNNILSFLDWNIKTFYLGTDTNNLWETYLYALSFLVFVAKQFYKTKPMDERQQNHLRHR